MEDDWAQPGGDQAGGQERPGDDQSIDLSLLIARLEDEVEYLRQEAEGWKNAGASRDQELEEQVNYLRRQLDIWQEEARRKDAIIMTMAQRIPDLEPAQNASESPETLSETPGSRFHTTPPNEEQPQRSFLRRFFGLLNQQVSRFLLTNTCCMSYIQA